MRSALFTCGLAILLLGCGDEQLVGTEAQEAFLRAGRQPGFPAESVLFMVDGKEMTKAEMVRSIDPKQIARIDVVKGAAAERLYGPRARVGAVVITTLRSDSASTRQPN